MKFLVIGRVFDDSHVAQFLALQEAEGKALWELYGAGVLQEALFGKQMNCLSFVFECRSRSEARQFVETLPSSKAELIDYRISELSGFANLTEQFKRHHSKLPSWLS
jgi:hypothetical protein